VVANPAARILVVDDEPSVRRVLRASLTAMGFVIGEESDGERALERLRAEPFDAVLLDVNMPGMGGFATCRLLRQHHPHLGILMLTVRNGRDDRVEALEGGADDYIVKPFDLPELVSRLRAVLRRVRTIPKENQDNSVPIRLGELELKLKDRSVVKSGHTVHLTPNEFTLLHCLMSHAGELVSYADVFRAVWQQEGVADQRRLRSLVHQLRKKIEIRPEEPTYIVTEPGFGYRVHSSS